MRCDHCGTLCAPGDPVCPGCRGPAAPDPAASGRPSPVQFCTMLFMFIGIAWFNAMAPRWYPSRGGINMDRVLMSGLVAMVCGTIGGCLGWFVQMIVRK